MKKKICLLVIFAWSVLFLTTGCSSKIKQYESIVADVPNDGILAMPAESIWSGTYFQKSGLNEMTVEVLDVLYSGEYQKSITDTLDSYTTNIFKDAAGVEFGVKDEENTLVYLNLMTKDFFDTEPYIPDISNSYEYATECAKNIAQNYVNLSEYEMLEENPITRYKEKDGTMYEISYYIFTFARKIEGIYTSDFIAIKMTSKGNLASIMMGDIGAFTEHSKIDVDWDVVNASIENKVQEIYRATTYQYLNKEITYQRLAITPNNQLVLYSSVEVNLMDNNDFEFKTAVDIITAID